MITCGELVALLCDYLSDELPAEQRHQVDHHLRHCSSCSAYHQSYTLLIRLTRRLPVAPLPPQLAQRLAAILTAQHPPPGGVWPR
jgi:anti-sigma factor RsiW